MLHYEQLFGIFLRLGKVNVVQYCKVKGEQVITIQMAQQLKPKILMLYQGNYFVVSVKRNFCQRQTHCIDEQDKFQSAQTGTENGFTESQTPRKQLQTIGISSVGLHAFMKTLKSNISEAYKAQVDCFKDSQSDSYDKNDIKEKVNDLVRLQEAMREKLKTASY